MTTEIVEKESQVNQAEQTKKKGLAGLLDGLKK